MTGVATVRQKVQKGKARDLAGASASSVVSI